MTVLPADAEKVVVGFIHDDLLPLPDLAGWSVSTVIPPGVTPVNRIAVRTIGGDDPSTIGPADWWRLDVRVWADGTHATEAQRSRTARLVLAHLRRRFHARTFAAPVALPDVADPTKVLTLFTVEVLLRGVEL